MITKCEKCESVHFNVRWNLESHQWEIVCEGCGSIYELALGVAILTGEIK